MKTRSILLVLLFVALELSALQPPMAHDVITSGVGYRMNPMGGGEESFHRGQDRVGPHGAQIMAAGDGVIVEHWPPPGTLGANGRVFNGHPTYGGMIRLQTWVLVNDKLVMIFVLYGHMARTFVHEGQHVTAGQVIGIQGATGDATGEHLHYEITISPDVFFDAPMESVK